jgi:Spy/CpxP family protein refolding chaperone
MNKHLHKLVFGFAIAVSALAGSAVAQEEPKVPAAVGETRPQNDRAVDLRMDILQQLGLTPEQVQRIRRSNIERRPMMMAAQAKVRETNAALDEALYADNVDEQLVKDRLRESQLAQAEVIKIRFMNELAIRRILTPEQLVRFRELRQRFAQTRENMQNRQQEMMEKRQLKRQSRPNQTPPPVKP